MWKLMKIWLVLTIIYSITTVYWHIASPDAPGTIVMGKGMSGHVEIKRGLKWKKYKVLAAY